MLMQTETDSGAARLAALRAELEKRSLSLSCLSDLVTCYKLSCLFLCLSNNVGSFFLSLFKNIVS